MVKSPPRCNAANLKVNIISWLENKPKTARTVDFSYRSELVIIITILRNSATPVKAFLTQKEESFHRAVKFKVVAVETGQKKGGPQKGPPQERKENV
jgi:hypothetical protein